MSDPCDKINVVLRDICRCERAGMTLDQCNRRRTAWGIKPLDAMPGEKAPEPPKPMTTTERIASFAAVSAQTVWRYVTFQSGMLTEEEMRPRLELCNACPKLVDGSCSLCGCSCKPDSKVRWLNKLAHRSSVCPDNPPRWGAVK